MKRKSKKKKKENHTQAYQSKMIILQKQTKSFKIKDQKIKAVLLKE